MAQTSHLTFTSLKRILYAPGKLPEFHRKLAKEGKKNLAFRVVFSANGKTLTDSEISPIYVRYSQGYGKNFMQKFANYGRETTEIHRLSY